MSIKGFDFNGVVHKYDYNALDNIPDIETDKTLTIDGAPADAKATGDRIANLQALVGSPLTASTAAGMTDHSKIYVYVGSETGYINGNWYYYDGSAWVSGGVYNSVAVDIDTTLTLSNKAPDSKVVGDAISSLNEDIANKAPIINAERTDKYTNLAELGMIGSVSEATVTGLGIARLVAYDDSNRCGNLREYDVLQDWGSGSCVITDDHLVLTGTSNKALYLGKNNSSILPLATPIPSGSVVHFGIIVKGDSTGGDNCRGQLRFYNESGTSISWNQIFPYNETTWIGSATLSQTAYSWQLILDKKETWVCNGLEVYPFIFATNNCIIDNNVISSDTQYPLDITGWSKLSTAPYIHTFQYKADTRTYIDNHTPDDYISTANLPDYIPDEYIKESEMIYISPEMFGAVGDGVTDDTAAVQACIDAASVRTDAVKPPMRAYGIYKTTAPLRMGGYYLDIFIRAIKYTGTDAAVILSGKNCKYSFDYIDAAGTNSVGIRVLSSPDSTVRYDGYESNVLTVFQRLYTEGNCLEMILSSSSDKQIMYSTYSIHKMSSVSANCIYVNAGTPNFTENHIHGQYVSAPNGYLYYQASRYGSGTKLYDFCIEQNIKNGIYGQVHLYRCRTTECMNHMTLQEPDRGRIFVFDDIVPDSSTYADKDTGIGLLSIDVSNAKTWEDVLDDFRDYYDETGLTTFYKIYGIPGPWFATFELCNITAQSGFTLNTTTLPPGKAFAYFNHVAFKPDVEVYQLINDTTYRINLEKTVASAQNYLTPTVFDINVNNCSIYLDWSYCAIAINEFHLIQYADKKASVYDKFGTKIFDGTNLPAGDYTFKCIQTLIDNPFCVMRDDTVVNFQDYYRRGFYTGSNEKWTISKAELIN